MPTDTEHPRPRRRVSVANATLRRIEHQRSRFATTYGAANSARARFTAASAALRAAAAKHHHRDRPEVAARLDALTAQVTALLDELHQQSERDATRALRTDARRLARTERNRHEHANP